MRRIWLSVLWILRLSLREVRATGETIFVIRSGLATAFERLNNEAPYSSPTFRNATIRDQTTTRSGGTAGLPNCEREVVRHPLLGKPAVAPERRHSFYGSQSALRWTLINNLESRAV